MKINRLASALTLSLLSLSVVQAAKYRVVELPVTELGQYSFSSAINDSGEVAVTVQNPFNPPIDVSLIDFESETLIDTLTDLNAAAAGNINDEDLAILYSLVKSGADNPLFQQLASYQSYLVDGSSAQLIPGLDQFDADLGTLTQSMNTITRALDNSSTRVGTSTDPYYKLPYTFEDGTDVTFVVHDFAVRGFADVNGVAVELPPLEATLGGESEAYDINNSLTVAGYGTTEVLETFQTTVENCSDEELRGDQPLELCLNALMSSGSIGIRFQRRAMIWQLDTQGNIIESRQLGLLLTPPEDDTRLYTSRALAINDNGIAVGESNAYYKGDTTKVATYAAIFDGENVTSFADDEEVLSSKAEDINNNNLVVGQSYKTVNGSSRSKFYVHDMNSGETIYPDDFFPGSSSVARAINDNNIVVGEGEVESTITGTRRREAFLYDYNLATFQNLNGLLACDSSYTISQANDINNDDVISATAFKRLPKLDIAGNEVLDDAGNVIFEDSIIAVKLEPIAGGTVDDCSLDDETFKRKGGVLGWWSLGLFMMLFARRAYRK